MATKSLTFDIYGRDRTASSTMRGVAQAGDDMTARLVMGGKQLIALTAGVAAGYVGLGTVIGAGFNRFMSVDNATAKLKSFGYTTEQITSILGSANQAALGTAFSFGDLADQAASAIASGVKEGDALTKYLGLITDAAAATNGTVGDIGFVFNQVTAAGRAYTQDMNQIVQRGIPVWRLLADEYGVNATQLRKMVSEGEVDSASFFQAIDTYIGGSAKKVDSLQASWSNTMAAIGRAGAGVSGKDGLFGPVLEEAKSGLKDITADLNAAQPVLDEVGRGVSQVVSFWGGLPAPVQAGAVALAAVIALRSPLTGTLKGVSSMLETGAIRWLYFADAADRARVGVDRSGKSVGTTRSIISSFAGVVKSGGSALVGAFGGPVTLAVSAGITVLSAAIAAWTAQTIAQKQAVAELTTTLDENTGAVTENTYSKIADNLDDVIKGMQGAGLETAGLAQAIAKGGPELDAYRQRLEAITKANTGVGRGATNAEGVQARVWLKAINDQADATEAAQEKVRRSASAAGAAVDGVAGSAADAGFAVDNLGDKLDGAFSRADQAAEVNKSLDSLSKKLVDNGKLIDSSTVEGADAAGMLKDVIAALANQAEGDSARFQGSVMGLMKSLRAQGVDTSKIMGTVRAAVEAVTGQKWTVLLDGSQSIAEAKKIAEANLEAAKTTLALQIASRGDSLSADSIGSQKRVAQIQAQIDELDRAAKAAKRVASSFSSAYSGAVTAAADKASAGADAKATAAQKRTAEQIRTQVKDLVATAEDGTFVSVKAINDMAAKQRAAIARAFRADKITSKQKTSLDSIVDDWKKSAKSARTDAASAAADLNAAIDELVPKDKTISDLSDGALALEAQIDAVLKAHGITKKQAADLKAQVESVDRASTSAEAWAASWGANGMVDGVHLSAREIIAGAADARSKIEGQFKQGLISKEARAAALASIDDTVTGLEQAAADAKQAVADAASAWAESAGLSDEVRKRLGMLSTDASALSDAVLDAYNAAGISAGQRDGLLAYIREQNQAMFALADQRQSVADALTAAQQQLDQAVSEKASWRQSIIDGITSLGDVTKTLQSQQVQIVRTWTEMRDGKQVTFQDAIDGTLGSADDIKKSLQDRIAATLQFQKDLATLRAQGLDDASYKAIVNEFTSTGQSATAQALLAGGQDAVQQIAALEGQLSDAASGLADEASSSAYDVSIAFGQGLVKGLQDQQDALDAIAAQMGLSMLASIKTALGIASPSKRARAEVGRQFGIGAGLGIADSAPYAASQAADMADRMLAAATVSPAALLAASDAGQPSYSATSDGSSAVMSGGGGTTVQVVNKTGVSLAGLVDVIVDGKLVDLDNEGTVTGW